MVAADAADLARTKMMMERHSARGAHEAEADVAVAAVAASRPEQMEQAEAAAVGAEPKVHHAHGLERGAAAHAHGLELGVVAAAHVAAARAELMEHVRSD